MGCDTIEREVRSRIIDSLRTTLIDVRGVAGTYSARGRIRSLCFTALRKILPSHGGDDVDVAFFVAECCAVVTGHVTLYRANAFACLCVLVECKGGIEAMSLSINAKAIKEAALMGRDGGEVYGHNDSFHAIKVIDALADQLVEQANNTPDESSRINSMACLLLHMDEAYLKIISQRIYQIDGGIDIILDILGSIVSSSFPSKIVQAIVDTVASENQRCPIGAIASPRHTKTVTTICSKLPHAIFLYSILAQTDDGINALVVSSEPLRVIATVLSVGKAELKGTAAGILSSYLTADSPFVLDSLRDLGVAILLFRALADEDVSQNFVQDALHIIGTLISHFGPLALNLGHRWADFLERLLDTYDGDDYICAVAGDILSDLRDHLKEEDDIAGNLGKLAAALTGTDPPNSSSSTEGPTIEPHFKVMDQLRALMDIVESLEGNRTLLETQLATPLVEILGRYTNERSMIAMALSILRKIGDDGWIAKVLGENEMLSWIFDILRKKGNEVGLTGRVLRILASASRKIDLEREGLLNCGTVSSICRTIVMTSSDLGIVEAGFSAISNLLSHIDQGDDFYRRSGMDAAIKASMLVSDISKSAMQVILQCLFYAIKGSPEKDNFREIPHLISTLDMFYHDPVIAALALRIMVSLKKCITVRYFYFFCLPTTSEENY